MRPWLLYQDREMNSQGAYAFSNDLVKDLNLTIIFKTMAKEDFDIQEAVRKVMVTPLVSEAEILYRQAVLKDVLKCPEAMEEILHTAKVVCSAMDARQGKTMQPRGKMIEDLAMLESLLDAMHKIRDALRRIKGSMESKGFRALLTRIEEYDWESIRENVAAMNFMSAGGKLSISMNLGRGMKLDHIRIEHCVGGKGRPKEDTFDKLFKFVNKVTKPNHLYLEEEPLVRDAHLLQESAMRHLIEHYAGINHNLKMFFKNLLFELSFYRGCYHLHARFGELGIPFAMPSVNMQGKQLHFEKLYELTLAIYTQRIPVSNDLTRGGKRLYIITGANQGGKSTFLRSIGIAQVMMQCGMFVPARTYVNNLYENILTHFTRREDQQMNSGRLEEEVRRMDKLIDAMNNKSMVLFNESFASTTEKEGSVIAGDITMALYEAEIDVFIVTHLFEFARKTFGKRLEHAVFLTAERKENGDRTFKMIEHEPNHTSYGLDLYDKIIGEYSE